MSKRQREVVWKALINDSDYFKMYKTLTRLSNQWKSSKEEEKRLRRENEELQESKKALEGKFVFSECICDLSDGGDGKWFERFVDSVTVLFLDNPPSDHLIQSDMNYDGIVVAENNNNGLNLE